MTGSPWPRLSAATAHLPAPVVVLDREALIANASDLARRAGDLPVRLATKSVRCREVLREVLALPGAEGRFRGLLAYTLAEALWLAQEHDDVLVAYPSADRTALAELAASDDLASRVTLMVDDPAQLALLDAVAPPGGRPTIRVCLELDASYDLPGLRVGVWRSPVRSAEQARDAARLIAARPGVRLVGVMAYEAQLAGLGDRALPVSGLTQRARIPVVRRLQSASWAELVQRRGEAVAAVRDALAAAGEPDLELVNGGGTGSLERSAGDPSLTEVAAGSGLFGPGLFDGYRAFEPHPAAAFALDVVRRPRPDTVTVLGGGWIASGPPGVDRQPVIAWPQGLGYVSAEGAGEVQTPLRGPAARDLAIGDRVWFRHAKAGELSEHTDAFQVVDGAQVVAAWPTYRGERKAFL